MNYFIRLIIALIVVSILVTTINSVFIFFSIPISVYGLYLIWFVALVLIGILIPSRNRLA